MVNETEQVNRLRLIIERYEKEVDIIHANRSCDICYELKLKFQSTIEDWYRNYSRISPRSTGIILCKCSFCRQFFVKITGDTKQVEDFASLENRGFCSSQCKNAAYYYHTRKKLRNQQRCSEAPRRCIVCNHALPWNCRTDRQTCSDRCRIALWRRKKRNSRNCG
jgi:predicted nucleic acid-binding Zn ribbon protein